MAAPLHPARFHGFPVEGRTFFKDLDQRQDRAWFLEHKSRYQSLWVDPMTALMDDLAHRLESTYPGITDAKRKIFRIQRDLRFTLDRQPYKTSIGASLDLRVPRKKEPDVAGMYIQLGLEDMAAAGRWMMDKDQVLRFREAVAHPTRGAAFQSLVDSLLADGFTLHAHQSLKRVPPPYEPDHPRGDLLKRKGLAVGFPPFPRALASKPAFADWLVAQATRVAPALRWLDDVVSPVRGK